jgi:imidazole glycerol-phosphate synthase subunit HisH
MASPRVALIDYGAGNLTSVAKGLRAAGADVCLTRSPERLRDANAIVLPGVGHFSATAPLDDAWKGALQTRIAAGVPLLGICLGLQWLFDGSDEWPAGAGLGIFPGRCSALTAPRPSSGQAPVKVPHVGWNTLDDVSRTSGLLAGIAPGSFAYYTHTYAAPVVDATAAITTHATTFTAAVERDRIFGVQFHPEKSARTGLRVLANFLALAAA